MRKILIVDDEETFRNIVASICEGLDFQVETCSGGWDALDLAKTKKFDLVISDVRMPQGDGVELLLELRKIDPTYPPVILMTGYTASDFKDLVSKGAVGVLSKPFDIESLEEMIDTAAGQIKNAG